MRNEEILQVVEDLEPKVERLKSLYQQFFMGIEKIPPAVLRKDVERTIWLLRRERLQNTRLKFKFQQIIQRYNTYQQYWSRVMRDIEKGTYKRDVVRAAKRFGRDDVLLASGRAAETALRGLERDSEIDVDVDVDVDLEEENPRAWDLTDDAPTPPHGARASARQRAYVIDEDDVHDEETADRWSVPDELAGAVLGPSSPEPQRTPGMWQVPAHLVGGYQPQAQAYAPQPGTTRGVRPPPQTPLPEPPPYQPPAPAPQPVHHPIPQPAWQAPRVVRRPQPAAPQPAAPQPAAPQPAAPQPAAQAAPPGAESAPAAQPRVVPAPKPIPATRPFQRQLPPPPGAARAPVAPAIPRAPAIPNAAPSPNAAAAHGAAAAPAQPQAAERAPETKTKSGRPRKRASHKEVPVAQPARVEPARAEPARAEPPQAEPSQPKRSGALPGTKRRAAADKRTREIYNAYVQARREAGESTANVTFDKLERSLTKQREQLRQKHAGRDVDFEVVNKDGRTVIRPVIK
jgi:hypothetical protein